MQDLLKRLSINTENLGCYGASSSNVGATREVFHSFSPINGERIAAVMPATDQEYDDLVSSAHETFIEWQKVPAPERGQVVRQIANAIRDHKQDLGHLVSLEVGKIIAEGEGEIQEVIDIADFAVGLSRQLYGKTMHSERRAHRMYEQWHPLGVVGIITAFNFPAAVWSWNSMIAAVCGDTVVWKPSELAPLTAIAVNNIAKDIASEKGFPGLFNLVIGNGPHLGQKMACDTRLPLISATGSTAMGRSVAQSVAQRLGKCLLELSGNNAIIVMADTDIDLTVRATLFGAVGTAGQRCTSIRRVIIQRDIEAEFTDRLVKAYAHIRIGDPRKPEVLMGPLVNDQAVKSYVSAIGAIKREGGALLFGGELIDGLGSNLYVQPTIVRAQPGMKIIDDETFAPILYVIPVNDLAEAIELNNRVPQGLSSAIFTQSLVNSEMFLSAEGSDCGIANVNLGTSGAEIGGAFGGEKDTGGGREAGSDSWKQYMRRQTTTINFGATLPLAQGIKFEL